MGIFSLIKRLTCRHNAIIYDGMEGGMGFLWRNMHCAECGKKFSTITATSPRHDRIKIGSLLSKDDIEVINMDLY